MPEVQHILLLFGGLSSEHEVSCVSASTFAANMPARFFLHKVGITRQGRWLYTEASPAQMADGSWEALPGNLPCTVNCSREAPGLVLLPAGEPARIVPIDVALPALHGLWGEDGTVQGLLELAGIPYVGCGVLASAICMDKAVANALFAQHGIPHCPWRSYTRYQWKQAPQRVLDEVEQALGYPIFVKPANAGSSVGVTRAADRDTLRAAVAVALREDDKLVFEAAVDGQEVECAVLGSDPAFSTLPGEILPGDEFYTYDDKYKNGVSQSLLAARLAPEKAEEVRAMALAAYTALGCEGLARCDFFVERGTGRVLINEINTLPGFTPISMWPKLMEHSGLSFPDQVEKLIALALSRAADRTVHRHG